jgi:hypothetical protein
VAGAESCLNRCPRGFAKVSPEAGGLSPSGWRAEFKVDVWITGLEKVVVRSPGLTNGKGLQVLVVVSIEADVIGAVSVHGVAAFAGAALLA